MEVVPGLHWVETIWDTKVYVWEEAGRVTLIDAAMPGRAASIWRFLAGLGYAPQAVAEIWLTHGDVDHMGSIAALKMGSGAQVVAHEADAPLVEGRAERQVGQVPFRGTARRAANWCIHHVARYQPTSVDRCIRDGEALGPWRVVHVPGHTAGSVCYYHAGRGIAIVGDALNHRRGRLGAPPPIFSQDMAQAYDSIRKIAALDIEVCCFGHGPPLMHHTAERVRALADGLAR